MTKRMLIMVALVLLLVAALAFGFYLHIQKLIASSPKPVPATVTATKVAALAWQPQFSSVGSLVAVRGVDVTSEIAGLVQGVKFKSGQEVKAGTVLVQLNADADIAQLNALKASSDLAQTVLKRDQAQLEAEVISQAQVDGDAADLKNKQALVAQQAAVIAKKTIVAPFGGKLGITTVNPGQYINPGDKIVTLQTIDPIYVDFFLPQRQLAGLTIGQTVNLTGEGYGDQTFLGKITAISPKVDTATRNVQVEATLPNPKRILLPGMFANVSVDVGEKQAVLTLPQTAITYNPYGSTVFVVKPKEQSDCNDPASAKLPAATLVVKQGFVTAGQTRGDQVAILKGLAEGDQVVTSGQLKLKNCSPVVIDNSVQPANSANPTPQEH